MAAVAGAAANANEEQSSAALAQRHKPFDHGLDRREVKLGRDFSNLAKILHHMHRVGSRRWQSLTQWGLLETNLSA
jgi:hypothetical protein